MMTKCSIIVVNIMSYANDKERINHCVQHNVRHDDTLRVGICGSQTTNLFRERTKCIKEETLASEKSFNT
jgi:Ni,Fe-hydrogenase III small subunit